MGFQIKLRLAIFLKEKVSQNKRFDNFEKKLWVSYQILVNHGNYFLTYLVLHWLLKIKNFSKII
jgi:hypothetical protein